MTTICQREGKQRHPNIKRENQTNENQTNEKSWRKTPRLRTARRSLQAFAVIAGLWSLVSSAPRAVAIGALDTSFGNGGTQTTQFFTNVNGVSTLNNSLVRSLVVQSDGKIVLGGGALFGSGATAAKQFVLARLNANGALDTAFGTNGIASFWNGLANAVALQSDGRIVLGGAATRGGGGSDFGVARYNAAPVARGVRVRVRGSFLVTNSFDGFANNTVEAYGTVVFGSKIVWNVARAKALSVSASPKALFPFSGGTYDVLYNNPSTWTISVNGFMNDADITGSDDTMWNLKKAARLIDLKTLSESAPSRSGTYTWMGDRQSESADLLLNVSRDSYIY